MSPSSTVMKRRHFLRRLAGAAVLATGLPGLAGCSNFKPLPFATGETARPPIGCVELRERDPRGDC